MKAFQGKKFDVEHLLSLYALSFITIPAAGLYDKERLAEFGQLVKDCHIYVVGFVPKVDLRDMRLDGVDLVDRPPLHWHRTVCRSRSMHRRDMRPCWRGTPELELNISRRIKR